MAEEIRWEGWRQAPRISHIDQSCQGCGFAGPLQIRRGRVLQPGKRVRQLTRRSDAAAGIRPQARTVWQGGYWALTHIAFRCPGCGEEVAYRYASGGLELVEVPELCRAGRTMAVVVEFPRRPGR